MPRSSQRDLLSQREVQVTCHYSQCVVDQLGVPWICSRAKELEFQSFVHDAPSLRKSEGHQEMRNGTSLVSQCKESACQCSRHEFNPWSRKIPHATEQLSLWDTAIKPGLQSLGPANTEPTCHYHWSPSPPEPVLCNKRSRHSKTPTHHN